MAYVELHSTIRHHHKTEQLMAALTINRREAVGILSCLYSWAIENRPGGIFERKLVGFACGFEGRREDVEAAMVEIKLLDEVGGDQVSIHDWEHYTRGYRKGRADAERRKRDLSAANALPKRDVSGELSGAERNGTERTKKKAVEQARPTAAPLPAVPLDLVGLELYEKDARLCSRWNQFKASAIVAYPGVDIVAQVRKAHAWEVANPRRSKIDRVRFLNNWLSKEQDAGRGPSSRPAAEPKPFQMPAWVNPDWAKKAQEEPHG